MKKTLLIILAVIAILGVGIYIFFRITLNNTKQFSPEQTISYSENDATVSIFYCRPSKKGRVIFGNLVPYGRWWRTGANEPTTITTSKDLIINNQILKAGKYHIITIPQATEWTVVFNSNIPFWGTSYQPKADVLRVQAPVENLTETVEMFTIAFEKEAGKDVIAFMWDQTRVVVPFAVK